MLLQGLGCEGRQEDGRGKQLRHRIVPCLLIGIFFQSYFHVAARLGDAGAQEELGFCYANGRGCKKDKKEAAKWYRLAVSDFNMTVSI